MDSRTRKAVSARDAGLLRVSRTTRAIGVASVAGAVIAAAGFAHVLPTHLPKLNVGSGSGSSDGSGGLQGPNNAPGGGSGSSQVRSGGS